VLTPLILIAVLVGGALVWAWSTFQRIDRVDLESVLDPVVGDTTNYLLVGSDSRDELDPEGDSGVTGRRSDTLILLRTAPDGALMMSIPRDLWVQIADTGEMGRINGAYNRGPGNLVQTVKDSLGVPVNHYMEVGFGSFAGMVDALGGVTIDFPHPVFDPASGLSVAESGPVTLDGAQALAYARSRTYTEVIDGREVVEPTGDLGRQERQQLFLRTVLGEVGGSRNPLTLARVGGAVSSELIVDSGLGFFEALGLVRTLGGTEPESLLLPVEGVRRGAAAVLVTVEPDAQTVLDRFR